MFVSRCSVSQVRLADTRL